MFGNYIKIAWRNLLKNKQHTLMNIVGLAVAFSIFILLFLTSYFQLSFDSFHKNKEHLFRVSIYSNDVEGSKESPQLPVPLGPALEADIPEVRNAVRVHTGRLENISYGDINIEKVIVRTDPAFFEHFSFPVLRGNITAPISGIDNIALSETTANALFASDDPLGKVVQIGKVGEEMNFTVTAVLRDCPANSSFRFDAVARIESLPDYLETRDNWSNNNLSVFLRLGKDGVPAGIEEKMALFAENHYSGELERLRADHPDVMDTREFFGFHLTPMEDIHFSGEKSVPLALPYSILGLGLLILLIACFNFVNLNLAQSFSRARELGIRKTFGAGRRQLVMQLWGEAFILYLSGFLAGYALAIQGLSLFQSRFGTSLELSQLYQPGFLLLLGMVFLVVTLLAGGYPALKMANFRLVEILKGNVSGKKPGALQNSLLVAQFAMTSLMICISWIAAQQLEFLRNKPIGFDKEQVISIPVGNHQDGRKILERMRQEVRNDPFIRAISASECNLGRGQDKVTSRTTIGLDYKQNQLQADVVLVDYDYFRTLGIPLLEGRDFDRDYPSDLNSSIVVTQSFVKAMGEPDPLGKFIGGGDGDQGDKIIGIVPDFNLYSPVESELPIIVHIGSDQPLYYLFLKVQADIPGSAMDHVRAIWEKASDHSFFNASFVDENIQSWYSEERALSTVFSMASGISIFLSCLGLFAISLMVIKLRVKEIGIRKVLGATVAAIVGLISWRFLKLTFLSLMIALPLAWYLMSTWIEQYAYRIDIHISSFLAVALLVAMITFLTVGYHAIRAALVNPVVSLKEE